MTNTIRVDTKYGFVARTVTAFESVKGQGYEIKLAIAVLVGTKAEFGKVNGCKVESTLLMLSDSNKVKPLKQWHRAYVMVGAEV